MKFSPALLVISLVTLASSPSQQETDAVRVEQVPVVTAYGETDGGYYYSLFVSPACQWQGHNGRHISVVIYDPESGSGVSSHEFVALTADHDVGAHLLPASYLYASPKVEDWSSVRSRDDLKLEFRLR